MTTEDIEQMEMVQESISKHYEGHPLKDFCDEDDLIEVCNTLFVILESRIPNWRTEINFDDGGVIED